MTPLVIFGSGGMGREAHALAEAMNEVHPGTWSVLGFVADWPEDQELLSRRGLSFLGTVDDALRQGLIDAGNAVAVAVGDSAARRRIQEGLQELGLIPATLIHPSAQVGPDVEIGAGSLICGGAQLTTSIRLGAGTIVNVCASVSHDCEVGDFTTIAPHAALLGRCRIGGSSEIHAGAAILPGVVVGQRCVVGAGSVVLEDVPDGWLVHGVPARRIRVAAAMAGPGQGVR